MRLGTLARKINITVPKLTGFLESQGIGLDSGANTKLTDGQIALVLWHYKTRLETEPEEGEQAPPTKEAEETPKKTVTAGRTAEKPTEREQKAPTKETEETATAPNTAEKPTEGQAPGTETPAPPASPQAEKTRQAPVSDAFAEIALPHELEEDERHEPREETHKIGTEVGSAVERAAHDGAIEVIKPRKIILKGLTVKGKIELPQPKTVGKKPGKETGKTYATDKIMTTKGRAKDGKRKPKGLKHEKSYNPVEAARRKKAWEDKKQKEQERKKRKQAKTEHYKKAVTPTGSTPPTPKGKPTNKAAKKQDRQEKPKGNTLQRFWHWMNT